MKICVPFKVTEKGYPGVYQFWAWRVDGWTWEYNAVTRFTDGVERLQIAEKPTAESLPRVCPSVKTDAGTASQEELQAAAETLDSLQDGTFYKRQDAACKEMFGHGVKFIPGGK